MTAVVDHSRLDRVIDDIYETSLTPDLWPVLLERIAALFHAGFADVFARTQDRTRYNGIAHGLDAADYQDVFLGHWFNRNVWGLTRPVELAGEIVSTREMVPVAELMHTEIFNDYLSPRGLHEGLRLSIWSGEGWIQDMSLLRPFSIGPYEADELALAGILLPHLQRAAAVTRRLGEADAILQAGMFALDGVDKAVFLLDAGGLVIRHNSSADAVLRQASLLFVKERQLVGTAHATSSQIRQAVAHAVGTASPRRSQSVLLRHPSRGEALVLTTVPLNLRADWSMLCPPAALAFITELDAPTTVTAERLVTLFGLTSAEAELALDLLAGQGIADIAERRQRSINTVRTHLRNLMGKTQVHRQTDLVRLLLSLTTLPIV